MRRILWSGFLVAVLLTASLSSAVLAAPVNTGKADSGVGRGGRGDDISHPLGARQRALRQQALQAKLKGQPVGKIYEVAKGQFVELAREGEDTIWTVLGEFGNAINPTYGGTPGPLHNQIPQPDRSVDNTTIWQPDFSQAYFETSSLPSRPPSPCAATTSSSRPGATPSTARSQTGCRCPSTRPTTGATTAAASYAPARGCSSATPSTPGTTLRSPPARPRPRSTRYLAQYDVWDRYDYNGNGNFNEPDGYIDHFQSVHAGEGEETGGGAQGSNAIWSHRWYAFYNNIGTTGPAFNKYGGVQVGGSNFWVGDYTIEPENGGVGVFTHEFGHDLGLPDLYDTAGNTCGSACENSTGFWTLMSSGSYGNDGTQDLGTRPTHLGAWEKFQLGWLNYEVAFAGSRSVHRLGPAETNTKQAQGLFVVLPDKVVTFNFGPPFAGDHFYYSGSGDGLDNFMVRSFNLPAGASLSAQVRYQIEADWDYAYVVVSTDNGATWNHVATNRSTNTNPNSQNFGNGITGTTSGNWAGLTADLSAYTGNVLLGFRYWTDGATVEPGFMVDEIAVTGSPTDGAETDAGWTFNPASGGFRVTTGTEQIPFFNAYVAEFRQYRGYDESLRTGPYNFGFLDNPALQKLVEHFPYQDGMLVSYWDSSQSDNNTSSHPGAGLILPIDAHPAAMIRADGNPWRARIQSFDSTFGLQPTDALTLHFNSQPTNHPSQPAAPVFDDRTQYYNPQTATAGVINPNTGTQVIVRSSSSQDGFMQLEVRPAQ